MPIHVVGESNGNPLQYSCLENPMDGGAWQAAVHGVAMSQTRLTSLSLFTFVHWRRKWQRTPVFLPGESQGQGSLVGCHLWGRTESDTTEVTQQQQQQHGINNITILQLINFTMVQALFQSSHILHYLSPHDNLVMWVQVFSLLHPGGK